MERVNIFNQVHKGLRVALYQTATLLQQTDFAVQEDAEIAFEQVKEIVMLFDEHARKEDKYILPAIHQFEPSVGDCFKDEHVEDMALSASLTEAIENFARLESADEKIAAGMILNLEFSSFMIFNLQHMRKEEDVLNKLLWRYYSDAEIMTLHNTVVESITPWHFDFYSKWMLRGLNNQEIIYWLKAVDANAPPVVYQTLLAKAKTEIDPNRFNRIIKSVSMGSLTV